MRVTTFWNPSCLLWKPNCLLWVQLPVLLCCILGINKRLVLDLGSAILVNGKFECFKFVEYAVISFHSVTNRSDSVQFIPSPDCLKHFCFIAWKQAKWQREGGILHATHSCWWMSLEPWSIKLGHRLIVHYSVPRQPNPSLLPWVTEWIRCFSFIFSVTGIRT